MGRKYCSRYYHKKGLRSNNNADMKVSEQFGIAASKGNQILGLIWSRLVGKSQNGKSSQVSSSH